MGKFKRNKNRKHEKPIKKFVKRFVSVKSVLDYIYDNLNKLHESERIAIVREDEEEGDDYNHVTSVFYRILFFDGFEYCVGHSIIVEDDEDWAQADSWEQYHCSVSIGSEKIQKRIEALEIMLKLENILN